MTAGNDRRRWLRRASAELDAGPIAPRQRLAGDSGTPQRGGAATRDARDSRNAESGVGRSPRTAEFGAERGGLAEDLLGGPAAEPRREGLDRGNQAAGSLAADVLAELGAERSREGERKDLSTSAPYGGADTTGEEPTEVIGALRPEDLIASFGPARNSSVEDTLITARTERRPGVFDDVRPVRPTPTRTRKPVPRSSVAAAVEGRRRGVEDAKRGVAPVGDAYEAAATVAASVAAGDSGAGAADRAGRGHADRRHAARDDAGRPGAA